MSFPCCEDCQRPVRSGEPKVWQYAEGWIQTRLQGGANALALPNRKPRFLCGICLDRRRHGGSDQLSLF